jgi:hypothetical protein
LIDPKEHGLGIAINELAAVDLGQRDERGGREFLSRQALKGRLGGNAMARRELVESFAKRAFMRRDAGKRLGNLREMVVFQHFCASASASARRDGAATGCRSPAFGDQPSRAKLYLA